MSAASAAALSGWSLGLVVAVVAVLAVALCAAIVLSMAARLGGQVAEAAADVRAQPTSPVDGIDMVNESADRILQMVRTLRKAVVDG